MKTNVRNEDAIARAMGWLDQLREDGRADPVSGSGSEPATADGQPANATPRPPDIVSGGPEMPGNVEIIERAPIGDALRIPIAWCEMDSCISHYAHPAALGEADIRARAIAAGWRVDALSRLACPQCQRSAPEFRTTRPIVRWDRDKAVLAAALMAAAVRDDATGGAGRRAGRGVTGAGEAALIRVPAQGRHREYLGDSGRAG